MSPRRAARIDGNQPEIVAGLRNCGATVQPLHDVGKGCPDLLVGWLDRNYLLEVKDPDGSERGRPSTEKLTKDQEAWHEKWRGQVAIVRSLNEALRVIGVG